MPPLATWPYCLRYCGWKFWWFDHQRISQRKRASTDPSTSDPSAANPSSANTLTNNTSLFNGAKITIGKEERRRRSTVELVQD